MNGEVAEITVAKSLPRIHQGFKGNDKVSSKTFGKKEVEERRVVALEPNRLLREAVDSSSSRGRVRDGAEPAQSPIINN